MQQYFICHPFIGTFGIKAVCSGEVYDLRLVAGTQVAGAGFFINGYSRKIPNFLVKAG
jgi:hypothetical protein